MCLDLTVDDAYTEVETSQSNDLLTVKMQCSSV